MSATENMKIKDIRMLALDIDGTLMNAEKQFPEINCSTLQECAARGIYVALVSGRSFELMRGFAHDLGVDAILAACNGTRIEAGSNGPLLFERTFTRAQAERILRTLEESDMYFTAYSRGKCYMGNPHIRPSLGPRYAHHIPGITGDADYPYETVCDRERLWTESVDGFYKFVVMGAPYDAGFQKIRDRLADMHLSNSSASRRNCEFMPAGIDKGSAVRFLCEKYAVAPEQVMAFGDQTNDLPMLNAAGWPVAMGNAEPIVKESARIIAPDHNLGGVGLVLNQYVLGDE